jgi:hypothetical protein
MTSKIIPTLSKKFHLKEGCGEIINNLQLTLLHFHQYVSVRVWNHFSVLLTVYLEFTVTAVIFTFIYIFKLVTSEI